MANNFINIAIYQIGTFSDSTFPKFCDFPIGGLFVRGVDTPLNTARGVLCYGALRSWAHGNKEYYTNLTLAQILSLSVTGGITAEDGTFLTTEDGSILTTE